MKFIIITYPALDETVENIYQCFCHPLFKLNLEKKINKFQNVNENLNADS